MLTIFRQLKLKRDNTNNCIFGCNCKEVSKRTKLILTKDTEEKKSPFSIYTGEQPVEIPPHKDISQNHAAYLISHDFISDIEENILISINQLIYCTSKQIVDYLTHAGIIVSKETVAKKLIKLKEKSFIKQMHFVSDSGISSFKVFTLGKHGKAVLHHKKIHVKNAPAIHCPNKIKKTLAANQLAIQMKTVKAAPEQSPTFITSNILKAQDDSNIVVRTQAILQYGNEKAILEVVRRNEKWLEEYKEKLIRYWTVIKSLQNNENTTKFLITQCEDYAHMLHAMEAFPKKLRQDLNPVFTYDRALITDFENAFFV